MIAATAGGYGDDNEGQISRKQLTDAFATLQSYKAG